MYNRYAFAGVMELVDVTDSKSVGGDIVWVRVPPPAPKCVDKKDAQQKHHTKVWCFCVIDEKLEKRKRKS